MLLYPQQEHVSCLACCALRNPLAWGIPLDPGSHITFPQPVLCAGDSSRDPVVCQGRGEGSAETRPHGWRRHHLATPRLRLQAGSRWWHCPGLARYPEAFSDMRARQMLPGLVEGSARGMGPASWEGQGGCGAVLTALASSRCGQTGDTASSTFPSEAGSAAAGR